MKGDNFSVKPGKSMGGVVGLGLLWTLVACGGGGTGTVGGGTDLFGGGGGVGERTNLTAATGDISQTTQNTPLDSGFPDPKKAVPNAGYFAHLNQPTKEDACLLPSDPEGNRQAKVRFNGYIGGDGFTDPNGFTVRVVHKDTALNLFQDTVKTHLQNATPGYFEFTIQIRIPADVADSSNIAVKSRRLALLQPSQGIGSVKPATQTATDEDGGGLYAPIDPTNISLPLGQRSLLFSLYTMPTGFESPYVGVETECSGTLCQHGEEGKQFLGTIDYAIDDAMLTWLKERAPCS